MIRRLYRGAPRVMSIRVAAIAIVSVVSTGCASTAIGPSDLPPESHPAERKAGAFVLLLEGVPDPMADELRSFARAGGDVREPKTFDGEDLRAGCGEPADLVLRPRLGREYFASNAWDRNLTFIYFSVFVVTLPITVVSAGTWPWYAHTVVDGQLEVLACESAEPVKYIDSFFLRSEGRWFVRTRTLREAQHEGAPRGLMRQLLSEAFPSHGSAR